MVGDVIALSQISESVDPRICADYRPILQALLLPKLSVVGLIAEETFGALVGLYVVLATAWASPVGLR